MFVNSEFTDLLRCLDDKNVRYLVVDGYAMVQHAEPRFTKGLDLWISTDSKNAVAVFDALRDFGAPLVGLTVEDFSEDGYFYQMGVPPTRVDILMGIPGVAFEAAWRRREDIDFDGLIVLFICRDDLRATKLASGRPQDLIDAELLTQDDED